MRSWAKRIRDAEARGDSEAVERITALRAEKDAERAREMDSAFAQQHAEECAREKDRAAAPFGRCAMTGDPLPDPGEITEKQAESRYGWAPCQVRYGHWPNGARVK